MSSVLPTRSFSRKNIGIMHAVLGLSACAVWDFDDDNCLSDATREFLIDVIQRGGKLKPSSFSLTSTERAVNPYFLFGASQFVWPRGYPLQLLRQRDIPRIIPPIDSVTEVIQVMQDVDPDVDAIWRLQNGVANFSWFPSRALKGELVGIDPSKMAPFNAQATLLSRHAASLALLPYTVHGRVSDIWRSYIMQYLLGQSNKGCIAFSSASVSHFRNSHNYMADHDAESQLYDQTEALLAHLGSRKATQCSLQAEFVVLMDDLYTRGFVELGDVQASVAWASAMIDRSPTPSCLRSKILPQPRPTERLVARRIVAVLHVNHDFVENVPIWMALHAHEFQSVQIYVPGSSRCTPINGYPIHCVSDDRKGYFAYESIVHAIERLAVWQPNNPDIEGFLFVHDDAIWKSDLSLGPVSRTTSFFTPNDEWDWKKSEFGLSALEKFCKAVRPVKAFFGQSDFYYVTSKDALNFATMGRQMRDAGVFLEIAVPTIFNSVVVPADSMSAFMLYTEWDPEKRHDIGKTVRHFCPGQFDIAHPVKLSSVKGILGHVSC
jgi:hypothetical protein